MGGLKKVFRGFLPIIVNEDGEKNGDSNACHDANLDNHGQDNGTGDHLLHKNEC